MITESQKREGAFRRRAKIAGNLNNKIRKG
jgi:hypothetical protein